MSLTNFHYTHASTISIILIDMKQQTTHIGGYPRIGAKRELKWALEKFWSGKTTETELQQTATELRKRHWKEQAEAGITHVTTNDFSLYDHILDTAVTFGIIPERFGFNNKDITLTEYFSLARGSQDKPALALTKWLNTNYHYLVPELSNNVPLTLNPNRILNEFKQAKSLNLIPKPVIIGPVTLLSLCRPSTDKDNSYHLKRLNEILPLYESLINQLQAEGATVIQLDEPILSTDLTPAQYSALGTAYQHFHNHCPNAKIILATYFGKLSGNLNRALTLPIAGLHIDAVSAPEDALTAARYLPENFILSVGIIDGSNIWTNDLTKSKSYLEKILQHITNDQLWIATSCSLQHVPHSLEEETNLPSNIRPWLAFSKEKLTELTTLAKAFTQEHNPQAFTKNQQLIANRKTAEGALIPAVRNRIKNELPHLTLTRPPFHQRNSAQQKALKLPILPTTTIGSFPQTDDIRQHRFRFNKGEISHGQYQTFLQQKTRECIEHQENLGLDVLVHGEFERNDMVEYFASGLEGFAVTNLGWVQSYGSRCTKPPIIWGDVHRPAPITLDWTQFTQTLTNKPVKGMLTGTTTILQWSFIRNDIPRTQVSQQIALALRDEIFDLEEAGTQIIQLDEAALREGLPLRENERQAYLEESRDSFLISTSGVKDETQIHTHMCYSQFDAIFQTIIELDADVISIETTRNRMALLDTFNKQQYPNEIGPGVWDIHSPRVPEVEEIDELIQTALTHIPVEKLWINPDCGLKTRKWPETLASLQNLVTATNKARAKLKVTA